MALSGNLPSMRSMYRAEPGYKLIEGDYSQAELRMMRIIARDETLGQALQTGDVYSADARAIFQLPSDFDVKKLKPQARQTAKVGHLAFQYGCGLKTFHSQMVEADQTIKYRTSELVFNALRNRYHRTVSYWAEELERVKITGYSETRIMRRRRVYPVVPPITDVSNYPIQGTVADMMNIVLIDLWGQLKKLKLVKHRPVARLIGQFHDAIIIEALEPAVPEVQNTLKTSMQRPVEIEGNQVILPVDFSVSTYWSEKE